MPTHRSLLYFLAATSFTSLTTATPRHHNPAPSVTPAPDPNAIAAAQANAAAAASAASALSNAAAAAASYSAIATGTDAAAPQVTGPDACGPKTPDPSVPDSCDTYVPQVQAPAAYGVQCLHNAGQPALNLTTCANLIPIMCTQEWQHPGEWVWATADGCSFGSFLPNDPNAAQPPQEAACEVLIYGAMLETCGGTDNSQYNIAAVNLVQLPDNSGTGQQVNSGYPSYLITPSQPRTLPDPNETQPNEIPAESEIAAAYAAQAAAFSSESAILATMTGTAAAAARSDLAEEYADSIAN